MKQKRSVIDMVVSGALPFISLGMVVLSDIISFGIAMPDKSFWIKAIINTLSLLCFFIPFKMIFKERFYASDRIVKKVDEYANRVSKVYDNNLSNFNRWTSEEFERRRDNFIKQNLQLTALSYNDFVSKYKMSKALIKADSELTKNQKKMLCILVKNITKIKSISSDKVLPGTEKSTVFNRINTSEARAEKSITIRKVCQSIVISLGLAMLVIGTDMNADTMSILTSLCLKLLFGLMHIFSASRIAHSLVNVTYFNELSEKTTVLDEFLEDYKIQ